MKLYIYLAISLLCFQAAFGQKSNNVTFEKIAEKCKDLPSEQRLTMKVTRFSITSPKVPSGEFGKELRTILSNAVQKTGCFTVMETDDNIADFSTQGGDNIDAQLVVTGEVTEFIEKKVKIGPLTRNNVRIGFILKVLNSQTGAILFSESVNGEATQNGISGPAVFGQAIFAGTSLSGALAQAVEDAVIKAVGILADKKDKIEAPVIKAAVKFDASNCVMLRDGKGPKIMILIPEGQTMGGTPVDLQQSQQSLEQSRLEVQKEGLGLLRDVIRSGRSQQNAQAAQARSTTPNTAKKQVQIEDAVTENILISKFIDAGFRVIDPKVYDKMRKQADSASDDVSKMAAIGLKMGANIIITGYAVSERVTNNEGLFSYRGSIQLRALTTDDATILASHTLQAGGVDAAESIASNKSLRNAGYKMADYMLQQLCKRNMTFADLGGSKTNSSTARVSGGATNTTTIAATNANFAKLKALADALRKSPKVKEVKSTLKEGAGTLTLEHTGSADDLVDFMSKLSTPKFEIMGMEGSQVTITMQ